MPADRDHHTAPGTGQSTSLWPGQDIPRQHGSPDADPALPWPDVEAPHRPAPAAVRSSLPWPDGDRPTQPVGRQAHRGQSWPADGHEPQWPADHPADGFPQQWAEGTTPTDGYAQQWAEGAASAHGHPQQWAAAAVLDDGSPSAAGAPPVALADEPSWSDAEHRAAGPDGGSAPPPVGPDLRFPGPPPVSAPSGGERRRWTIIVAAAVALAVAGGGVAVATMRDPDRAPEQAIGTAESGVASAPAPGANGAAAPSATPGGTQGLGDRPASASPPAAAVPGQAPPFAGTRQTLPGASIAVQSGETFSQALNRSDRTFGTLKMARVFYPGLPPAWEKSRADVADRTVVVSFKASPQEVNTGKYDARLTSWFRSIPRDHNVYWSYFHEPEDDVERGAFTAAAYKSAWRRIAGLAAKVDNPKLINTLILMCWTLDPKSRRSFDSFYPGSDVVETLGWDCYNWGAKWKRYAPPQEIYGEMISKSRELGKPWGVAETGSDLVPGDSGTGRAAWIRSMTSYLNGQRPEFVAYYNQVVSQGDFRLQDAPSIQAWRSFCVA
ncbi:hypothetical protein MRQ36_12065 [Micromonospora sp. R77]|uniref:hypothetical protein n=1 Tax=Micromonospora sp. R77 TaxID=2925836 RepID=UPI001F60F214|nr:hypothetical protein [Micromonospora sp. R77]MCI4063266.1 hypothetical protein [Micromonospora sp. R77]